MHARILGYVGGALFVLVLVAGVSQPRFLHPQWYRRLHDRLGKKAMSRLRSEAFKLDREEWLEVTASEELFHKWVDRTIPREMRQPHRGYSRPS
jgi:hypothetical protein